MPHPSPVKQTHRCWRGPRPERVSEPQQPPKRYDGVTPTAGGRSSESRPVEALLTYRHGSPQAQDPCMSIGLWILLGLMAWIIVPLPLALLIGRLIRRGDEPEVVGAEALVPRTALVSRPEVRGVG